MEDKKKEIENGNENDKKEKELEYNPAEEYAKNLAAQKSEIENLQKKYDSLIEQNKSLNHALLNNISPEKEKTIDHEANQKRINQITKKLADKDNVIYPSNYEYAKDVLELHDLYVEEGKGNIFENPLLRDRSEIAIDKEGAKNFEDYLRYAVEEFKDAPHLFQADLEHRMKE